MSKAVRLLLIDRLPQDYHLLRDLLRSIETSQFDLDWVTTSEALSQTRTVYDIHIIEQGVPVPGQGSNYQWLLEQVTPAPVILLTNSQAAGRASLEAGVMDYWEKSQLSAPLLERSLRLTLAAKRTQTLVESEKLHRLVVSQIADALLLADDTGRFTVIGPHADDIFGYTTAEIERLDNISKLLGENLFDVKELEKNGQIANLEREITDKQLRKRYLLIDVKRLSMKGGTVLYICRDITERKQAEEAQIKTLAERFKIALKTVGEGITMSDRSGYFEIFNSKMEEITGYSKAEANNSKNLLALLYPDPQEYNQAFAGISDLLQSGGYRDVETTIITKDGTRKTILLSSSLVQVQGEYLFLSAYRDISDRKRAQEALTTERNKLAAAQEIAQVGSWEVDLATQKVTWSQETFRIFGLDPDRPTPRWSKLKIYPEDRPLWESTLKRTIAEGKAFEIEHRIVQPLGFIRHAITKGQPIFNSDSQVIGIFGTVLDITERKLAEEELRHSKLFIEAIIDTSPQLLYILDLTTGGSIYANHQVVEILGYRPEEVTEEGRKFFRDRFHPDDLHLLDRLPNRFARVSDGEVVEVEFRIGHKNGSWRWLRARQVVFTRDNHGAPKHILGTALDITDRQLVEMQLRESETRLNTIVSSTSDGILIVDRQGWVRFANPAAALLFNRSLEDLLAQEFGKPIVVGNTAELQICRDRGELGFGEMSVAETEWLGESVYVISLRDITERRQAEAALRESEQRFRQLAENIQDVFWLFDPETDKLLYVSPAYEQISGRSCASVCANIQNWIDAILPEDREMVIANMAAQRSGKATTQELRMLKPNGEICWICDRAFPIKNERGAVVRIAGIAEDISDRKQAETANRQQLERERLLAQIAQDIRRSLNLDEILNTTVNQVREVLQGDRALIFRLESDRSGIVTHESVSSGWPPTIGFRFVDEEFPPDCYQNYCEGKPRIIPDIKRDPVAACLLADLQQLGVKSKLAVPILQRETLWGLLIVHKCAEIRYWETWEVSLLGELATQVAIAIQQAELLEKETRQREELARSNAELEQFAYIASHDLREPLRTIISYAQLLEEDYKGQLDADADENMYYIVDAATRMQQLIKDLLTFSRVGTRQRKFAPTDCNSVMERVLVNLKIAIAESAATITYDLLPTLVADELQLTQLFQNLIGNGLKFRGQRPPVIHISAFPREDEWCFCVRDNGIGIEQQYADRIFAIFQRLHSRKQYEGTGIGLAICQKIVQRHGGRIWVESTLGQGAAFYFTISHQTPN
ncbi:MAG: PAS domain S-box protein [Hormoscilla sp.]